MSISSDDDTNTTTWDGQYDSKCDSNVDMYVEDDVDAPDAVDLDGDVDMKRDGDNGEDEKEEEEIVDEDEEEDEDEDNGKKPRTIGQGDMVNTSANDADTMVDDQPTVLPSQGQEIREHTPRPQTLEPCPGPQTPETHTVSVPEFWGF